MNITDFNQLIDSYKCYCKSDKQEAELLKIVQNRGKGFEKAKDDIVKANMYRAGVFALKFCFSKVEIEDLWSAALEGILASIGTFDPGRGVPFHIYAEFRMKDYILDCIGKFGYEYSLPKEIQNNIRTLKKVTKELSQEYREVPSPEMIAARMKTDKDYVEYLQALMQKFHSIDDSDDIIDEDIDDDKSTKDIPLKDILQPLDYEIYIRSIGLNGFNPMTHNEILKDINRMRKRSNMRKCTSEDIIIHYNRAEITVYCFDCDNKL